MKKILVVEDEPGIALGLEDDLKMEGYDVEVIGDGVEASRRAKESPFDLIVLDVMLPGKDGFEVCRDLRRNGLRLAHSDADRQGAGRRKSDGPGTGRRRLPHQTLRHSRASRAH